jgi:hypothetical protein
MSVFNAVFKHRYLVVACLVLLTAFLYFIRDFRGVPIDTLLNQKPQIRKTLACTPRRIADDVLMQRKESEEPIRLLVHFNEEPNPDVRDFLAGEGVSIFLDSWLIDYLVAETTVDRLCFLDQLPGITLITAGEAYAS